MLSELDYANVKKYGFDVDVFFQPLVSLKKDENFGKPIMCETLTRFNAGGHMINPGPIISALSNKKVTHYFELVIFFKAVEALSSWLEKNEVHSSDTPLITINMLPSTLVYYSLNQNLQNGFPSSRLKSPQCDSCSSFEDCRGKSLGCALAEWIRENYPRVKPGMIVIEIVEMSREYGLPEDEELKYLNCFDLHFSAIDLMRNGFYVLIDDFGSERSNAFRMTVPSNGVKIDGRLLATAAEHSSKGTLFSQFITCRALSILETAMTHIYVSQQRCLDAIQQHVFDFHNFKDILVIERIENEEHVEMIHQILDQFWKDKGIGSGGENLVILGQGYHFERPVNNLSLAMQTK